MTDMPGARSERWINLYSDVVTLPTPEMFEAMAKAPLGDDNKGQDPTANKLEAMSADMMGKEAALLLTSGTMGNLVGVMAHTLHGQEIIVEGDAHLYHYENWLGGIAGLMCRRVPGQLGYPSPGDVEAAIRPPNLHMPETTLICLENTHNRAGGTVISPEQTSAICDVAHRHGIAVHIDGARLFNTAVALGVEAAELVKDADSVTFCLSKALSCPVGSLLCGSADYIARARRLRKMLGGGARQAGVIAAPGIVALETMIDRLAVDHENARRLAKGLAKIPGIFIDMKLVQTNMVRVDVAGLGVTALEFEERLESHDLQGGVAAPTVIRLVTHRHITAEHIDRAIEAVRSVVRELS